MELTFKIYYKDFFRQDILNFVAQIPVKGNKHYDRRILISNIFFKLLTIVT